MHTKIWMHSFSWYKYWPIYLSVLCTCWEEILPESKQSEHNYIFNKLYRNRIIDGWTEGARRIWRWCKFFGICSFFCRVAVGQLSFSSPLWFPPFSLHHKNYLLLLYLQVLFCSCSRFFQTTLIGVSFKITSTFYQKYTIHYRNTLHKIIGNITEVLSWICDLVTRRIYIC